MKFKGVLKNSILAFACFSCGYIGATYLNPAFAQTDDILPSGGMEPELRQALKNHFQNKFFRLIDASQDQKEKISTLVDEQLDYATPIRQKMRANGFKLADMIADQSVSDEALSEEIDKVHALKDQIAAKRRKTLMKIRSLLSKEQKEIVAARIKARLSGNPRVGLMLKQ